MRIYVGNLSFDVTGQILRELFEAYGQVVEANIIWDREEDRSRGFGFVDMPEEKEAMNAIGLLNGTGLLGRSLKVNPARPMTQKRQGL